MSDQFRESTYLEIAEMLIEIANEETKSLHMNQPPGGHNTKDTNHMLLLYRAAEVNMRLHEMITREKKPC